MTDRTPQTWDPACQPTAQERADWLKVCTDAERLAVVQRMLENADTASLCWQADHVRRIEDYERQQRERTLATPVPQGFRVKITADQLDIPSLAKALEAHAARSQRRGTYCS